MAAALGLAACGGDSDTTDGTSRTTSTNDAKTGKARGVGLVSAYCLYRSDTRAQALACEARTDTAQVQSAEDEAARWARGELQACGKSAGELCQYYRDPPESQAAGDAP